MFSSGISPGQRLLAKTVTNTKKEEVEMIVRGFSQVLTTVRGWCRLTSEKASGFQNTGRGGGSQREGRSSDYQPPRIPGNVLGAGLQPCIHFKYIFGPEMLDTSVHGKASEPEIKPGQNNRSLAKFR